MEAPIELNNVQFAVFWQLAAKKLNYKVDLADAMSVNDDPDTGALINLEAIEMVHQKHIPFSKTLFWIASRIRLRSRCGPQNGAF